MTGRCDGHLTACRSLAKVQLCRVFFLSTRQNDKFAECFSLALGKMISLPSVFPQHSAKPKLFFPLLPSKLFLPSTYNMWYYMLKFGIFLIRLIYLINLLRLEEFFGISQIWTASDSNNIIKWVKNDIHVIKSIVRLYPGNEKKFRTFYSKNTTTNVWPNDF